MNEGERAVLQSYQDIWASHRRRVWFFFGSWLGGALLVGLMNRLASILGHGRLPFGPVGVVLRIVAMIGAACGSACSLCSETPISVVTSRSGKRAVVIVRDCGATTDFATIVKVGGFFSTDVLAVRGKAPLALRWSADDAALTVWMPKTVPEKDLFVKASRARGVNIVVERE